MLSLCPAMTSSGFGASTIHGGAGQRRHFGIAGNRSTAANFVALPPPPSTTPHAFSLSLALARTLGSAGVQRGRDIARQHGGRCHAAWHSQRRRSVPHRPLRRSAVRAAGSDDDRSPFFSNDRSGRLKLLGVAVAAAAGVALTLTLQGDRIEVPSSADHSFSPHCRQHHDGSIQLVRTSRCARSWVQRRSSVQPQSYAVDAHLAAPQQSCWPYKQPQDRTRQLAAHAQGARSQRRHVMRRMRCTGTVSAQTAGQALAWAMPLAQYSGQRHTGSAPPYSCCSYSWGASRRSGPPTGWRAG